jgi:outer membrane immunogenic protein
MKKWLAAAALLTLIGTPVMAADMRVATKAPPRGVPAPVYSWTGCYIGVEGGGAWGRSRHISGDPGTTGLNITNDYDVSGGLVGAEAGCNYQVERWVFGVEGDWSWTDANGCSGHVVFPAYSGCTNNNWYATVTGRLGVAFDRSLVYAKGGVAFADQDHVITFNGVTTTDNPSNTRTGWTVGAGWEYALFDNWSAKIEYDFMDFGKESTTFNYSANPAGLQERWNIDQQVHVVKVGLNYRFH